jgi:hypothetical protein
MYLCTAGAALKYQVFAVAMHSIRDGQHDLGRTFAFWQCKRATAQIRARSGFAITLNASRCAAHTSGKRAAAKMSAGPVSVAGQCCRKLTEKRHTMARAQQARRRTAPAGEPAPLSTFQEEAGRLFHAAGGS